MDINSYFDNIIINIQINNNPVNDSDTQAIVLLVIVRVNHTHTGYSRGNNNRR